MTCFVVVALRQISGLPSGVAGIPMMAEMKMAAGLADHILNRTHAITCRGLIVFHGSGSPFPGRNRISRRHD
jgi:hypothetical protein